MNGNGLSGTWCLVSAEARAAAFPRTFDLLPTEERSSLRVGEHAKLIFEFVDEPGERMWVRVIVVNPDGQYIGCLENQACSPRLPALGQPIPFGAEHVVAIIKASGERFYEV